MEDVVRIGKGIATFAILSLIVAITLNVVWIRNFRINCENYLQLVGNAQTVEQVDECLRRALLYLERKNLTKGNSAILFRISKHDIGKWYQRIREAKAITASLVNDPKSVSQDKQKEALGKVRAIVLKKGKVIHPPLISWFPYQFLILLWWIFSVFLFFGGGAIWFLFS